MDADDDAPECGWKVICEALTPEEIASFIYKVGGTRIYVPGYERFGPASSISRKLGTDIASKMVHAIGDRLGTGVSIPLDKQDRKLKDKARSQELLKQGHTIAFVALEVGISERSVYRYQHELKHGVAQPSKKTAPVKEHEAPADAEKAAWLRLASARKDLRHE